MSKDKEENSRLLKEIAEMSPGEVEERIQEEGFDSQPLTSHVLKKKMAKEK